MVLLTIVQWVNDIANVSISTLGVSIGVKPILLSSGWAIKYSSVSENQEGLQTEEILGTISACLNEPLLCWIDNCTLGMAGL